MRIFITAYTAVPFLRHELNRLLPESGVGLSDFAFVSTLTRLHWPRGMMIAPEAFRYIGYVRVRWCFVAVSLCSAVLLALLISLILPRQYTATARIVIEPPAGADPRSALAVSPIYLESLKTYERFADGDSLFRKALDRLQLRNLLGSKPIESLKSKVLKVGLVHSTRILEIRATLPDAARAQTLAEFIANETVSLNHSITDTDQQDLMRSIEQQQAATRNRLAQVDTEWIKLVASEPIDDLRAAIEQAGDQRAAVEQHVANANVQLADTAARQRNAPPSEAELLEKEQITTRAVLAELYRELDELARDTATKEKLLEERLARRDQLDVERKADAAAAVAVDTRLRDVRNELGYRGERLNIIDPGVIPERPSSPNLSLNLAAAALLGLLFPLAWLALEMNWQQQRVLHALARNG